MALSQFEDKDYRKDLQNTAYIKEALLYSAEPLPNLSITEQGSGVFQLDKFMARILESKPSVEIYPPKIDIRQFKKFNKSTIEAKNNSDPGIFLKK